MTDRAKCARSVTLLTGAFPNMQTVTVIATKDFTADDGRQVQSGDAVALVPIEAAVRGRAGEVSLDPGARTTYRTRDMNAAPLAVLPEGMKFERIQPSAEDAQLIEDTPQLKTRRRRRRQNKAIQTS